MHLKGYREEPKVDLHLEDLLVSEVLHYVLFLVDVLEVILPTIPDCKLEMACKAIGIVKVQVVAS